MSIIKRTYLIFDCNQNEISKNTLTKDLSEEYEKCMVDSTSILKEAVKSAINAQNKRERIQVLSLAKECYTMKLVLLFVFHSFIELLNLLI